MDANFKLAVDLYTEAIGVDPNNAKLFADRSQAHVGLCNFTEAVTDANIAIQLDSSMNEAYAHRITAYSKLAEQTLVAVTYLAPADERVSNLTVGKRKRSTSLAHLKMLAQHYPEHLGHEYVNICRPCAGQCSGDGMLVKQSYKNDCRICTRPFFVVKYKAAADDFRKTEICYPCSRKGIICQKCGQAPLPQHGSFLKHITICLTAAQVDKVRQIVASGGHGVERLRKNGFQQSVIYKKPVGLFDFEEIEEEKKCTAGRAYY